MLQLAICDDDKLFREQAAKIADVALQAVPHSLRLFDNAEALQFEISEGGYVPDIAVLDIRMAGTDGITLAKDINKLVPDCRVIFISSYSDYLMDAYETEHIYYVLKSDMERRLPVALDKALSANSICRQLVVKSGSTRRVIPLRDVLYLERQLHKTIVHTFSETLDTSQSPQNILDSAEAASEFIRCHQSYWVNCRAILSVDGDAFELSDGRRIPISRARKAEAREAFFRILSGTAARQ